MIKLKFITFLVVHKGTLTIVNTYTVCVLKIQRVIQISFFRRVIEQINWSR